MYICMSMKLLCSWFDCTVCGQFIRVYNALSQLIAFDSAHDIWRQNSFRQPCAIAQSDLRGTMSVVGSIKPYSTDKGTVYAPRGWVNCFYIIAGNVDCSSLLSFRSYRHNMPLLIRVYSNLPYLILSNDWPYSMPTIGPTFWPILMANVDFFSLWKKESHGK